MLQSLSIFFVVAATFGILAKILKLPILVGYLMAGIVIALSGLSQELNNIDFLGHVGVTFLLFLIGLEIRLNELFIIGRSIIIVAIGQILITFILAFLFCLALGFSGITSLFIAIGLSYSSTVIIIKILSEKKDISSLYGKLTIGILLIQDLSAIVILLIAPVLSSNGSLLTGLMTIMFKSVLLISLIFFVNKIILPKLFDKILSGSSELLFIFGISWALGLATLSSNVFGLSMEIGGFLAGLTLASLPEQLQLISKVRPLRDFFLTLFFLYLGSQLFVASNILTLIPRSLALSAFVLIVSPLVVLVIMGLLGFRKRTSFNVGISMAQISEFSLIVVAMGNRMGYLSNDEMSTMVFVGIITFAVSSLMISNSERIYSKTQNVLKYFEKKTLVHEKHVNSQPYNNHILLIGCDRAGSLIRNYLIKKNIPILVVDFNPEVYKKLMSKNVPVILGDISDNEVAYASGLENAKMLISTIGNYEDNLTILEQIKNYNSKAISIFTANSKNEALTLYEKGASYVIIPERVAGEYIRHLLILYKSDPSNLIRSGKNHLERLIFANA